MERMRSVETLARELRKQKSSPHRLVKLCIYDVPLRPTNMFDHLSRGILVFYSNARSVNYIRLYDVYKLTRYVTFFFRRMKASVGRSTQASINADACSFFRACDDNLCVLDLGS